MTDNEIRAYLTRDGNLSVPCSRWGNDTESCAEVAILALRAFEAATDPVTTAETDHIMGLVVNDHDDIAHLLGIDRVGLERA